MAKKWRDNISLIGERVADIEKIIRDGEALDEIRSRLTALEATVAGHLVAHLNTSPSAPIDGPNPTHAALDPAKEEKNVD
jgi:hypothetical protein